MTWAAKRRALHLAGRRECRVPGGGRRRGAGIWANEEDHSMRIADPRVWLPALALIMVACAPHHRFGHMHGPHHGGPGMVMACGPDACAYGSKCFSNGAV